MRSFARPFTVLVAMVLFQMPAFAQIDVNPNVQNSNIQNLPENVNLENLQDVDLTRGYHLLTVQVPVHARDLHQEIENIRVWCGVDDGDSENIFASGYTDVPYQGRTIRTTVSVPLEFPENQEGNLTLIERLVCSTFLEADEGNRELPHTEAADPRFLLDEESSIPPIIVLPIAQSLGDMELPF